MLNNDAVAANSIKAYREAKRHILRAVMKVKHWKPYVFWILFTEAVGALSGFLTREGSRLYSETVMKPPLSPPAVVFPIVWGVLFLLMGISAARVWLKRTSPLRDRGILIYLLQLFVNFFWSIIFFNMQAFGFALVWLILLWVLVLLMILTFRKIDRTAAWLQIPYLLWLSFAAYLNWGVWMLNR